MDSSGYPRRLPVDKMRLPTPYFYVPYIRNIGGVAVRITTSDTTAALFTHRIRIESTNKLCGRPEEDSGKHSPPRAVDLNQGVL